MGLLPAPSFWGLIVITAGINDEIKFSETDGTTPSTRTATIAAGSYYPDSIVSGESLSYQIAAAMTAASLYGATYTCQVNTQNGIVEIAGSGGSMTGFHLMLTSAESAKLLTGGDASATMQGLDHFGWVVDSGYPSYAIGASSDSQICNAWHPQGPLLNQTTIAGQEHSYRKNVSQVETLGHKVITRSWEPRIPSTSMDYSEIIQLAFQFLTDTDRSDYQKYFWSTYAFAGGKIRFFPTRTDLSVYTEVHVWQGSVGEFKPGRLPGYPHFNHTLLLKRYKD